jgi:hypothetical protein
MVKAILKLRMLKDERVAGNLLCVIALVCTIASIAIGMYALRDGGGRSVAYHLPDEVTRVLPAYAQEKIKYNGK